MDYRKSLTSFLDGLKEKGVHGCSMAIRCRGEELYRYYGGYTDISVKNPIVKDTIFRIYSMTKIVTAVSALQLYERGMFLLNDPLDKYLPEFSDMKIAELTSNGQEKIRPARNKILIKDVFRMTAGFTYNGYDGKESVTVRRVREMEAGLDREFPGKSYTCREYVKRLAELPLAYEPGTHWLYSLGHSVLAALVEVISGKGIGDYMEENIFSPLGMKDTSFRITPEKKKRLASMYSFDAQGQLYKVTERDDIFTEEARYENGGGGLLSTLDDYLVFAEALCSGGLGADGIRILGRKTVELMSRNHLEESMREDFDWIRLKGYGYGLGVRTMIDPAVGGCNGSLGEFGWSGLAGTWVLMDPMEKITAVYMQQFISEDLNTYIQPRLRAMIYAGIEG